MSVPECEKVGESPVGVRVRVDVGEKETVWLSATALVSDCETVGVRVRDLVPLAFHVTEGVALKLSSGLAVKDFVGVGGDKVRVWCEVREGEHERLKVAERVGGVIEGLSP